MDFNNDKIPILLDPNQGLRAVGIQRLEDLNIKQLQKVAEGVNEKYRIKNYKALTKAQLISEIETRFPHLRGKKGKLEDLSLKQLQTLTTKYQQEHLIKNIKKMNKAQLIQAIRKVAPHLEDTAEVRTPTPEPVAEEPEPVAPEVIKPTFQTSELKTTIHPDKYQVGENLLRDFQHFREYYKLFYVGSGSKKRPLITEDFSGNDLVFNLKGKWIGYKTLTSYRDVGDEADYKPYTDDLQYLVYFVPELRKAYKAYYGEDPPKVEVEETDEEDTDDDDDDEDTEDEDTDRELVDTVQVSLDGDDMLFMDETGDIMNQDGDVVASKGDYVKTGSKIVPETRNTIDTYITKTLANKQELSTLKRVMDEQKVKKKDQLQVLEYRRKQQEEEIRKEEEKQQSWDVFRFIREIEDPIRQGTYTNDPKKNIATPKTGFGRETIASRVSRTDFEEDLRRKDKMISSVMKVVARPIVEANFEDVKQSAGNFNIAVGNVERKIYMPLINEIFTDFYYQLQNAIDLFPTLDRRGLWGQLVEAAKYAREAYGYDILKTVRRIPKEVELPSGRIVLTPSFDFRDGGNFIADYDDSQLEDLQFLTDYEYNIRVTKYRKGEVYYVNETRKPFERLTKYIRGEPIMVFEGKSGYKDHDFKSIENLGDRR